MLRDDLNKLKHVLLEFGAKIWPEKLLSTIFMSQFNNKEYFVVVSYLESVQGLR